MVARWALHVNYSNLWSQVPPLQTAAGIRQAEEYGLATPISIIDGKI